VNAAFDLIPWPERLANTLVGWAQTLHPELAPSIADTLQRCVSQLEQDRAAGHVLLQLSSRDAAQLRATSLVEDDPSEPQGRPLVINAAQQLYLHRDFEHEQALAAAIQRLRAAPPAAIAPEPLRSLFPPQSNSNILDWQALAVAQALRQRLTLISGGPGTGKTSTVVKLLACVLAEQPQARIRLAAPTGKAAQRMLEALRAGAEQLAPQLGADLQAQLMDALPTEALTLHRLLGAGPQGFSQGKDNPLSVDWLIVDEASMLDLALARQLFDALPDSARLVLLGDRHQLAAVENGAVLAELGQAPSWTPETAQAMQTALGLASLDLPQDGDLPDLAISFQRSHRFAAESGIGRFAQQVRDGLADAALATLHEGAADLHALPATPDLQAALADGFGPYAQALQALWQQPGSPELEDAVWQTWARFRVLCAGHAGPMGTRAVNAAAAAWLRAALPRGAPPELGQPLLITRNQAAGGLVNGDIALLLPEPSGSGALQAQLRRGLTSETQRLPLERLPPELDGAFALTVHKSQGSEFDAVLLLVPELEWLSREWLYTGATRARQHLGIAGTAAALQSAVGNPTLRRSGLRSQLCAPLAGPSRTAEA
jgi:exodeoxyribonuclease V alpha subunit